MKNIILPIAIISLFVSSCCTKKDCIPELYPTIKITIEGVNHYYPGYVIVTLENTGVQVDSFNLNQNVVIISQDYQGYSPIGRTYQIHSDSNRVDTVHQVNYDMTSETIECNDCFMKKDLQDVSYFQNLSFYVNDTKKSSEAVSLYP